MNAAETIVHVSKVRMNEHRRRMRRLAIQMMIWSTVGLGCPLISLYLGPLMLIGGLGWAFAILTWRRASALRPEGSSFKFVAKTIAEVQSDQLSELGAQPICATKAFTEFLRVTAGRMEPTIALRDIEIPWSAEEKALLTEKLARDHGLAIDEGGSYARFLLTAILVGLIAAAVVLVFKLVMLGSLAAIVMYTSDGGWGLAIFAILVLLGLLRITYRLTSVWRERRE